MLIGPLVCLLSPHVACAKAIPIAQKLLSKQKNRAAWRAIPLFRDENGITIYDVGDSEDKTPVPKREWVRALQANERARKKGVITASDDDEGSEPEADVDEPDSLDTAPVSKPKQGAKRGKDKVDPKKATKVTAKVKANRDDLKAGAARVVGDKKHRRDATSGDDRQPRRRRMNPVGGGDGGPEIDEYGYLRA